MNRRGKIKNKKIINISIIVVILLVFILGYYIFINKFKEKSKLPNFEKEDILTISIVNEKAQAILYKEEEVNNLINNTFDNVLKDKKNLKKNINQDIKEKINIEISVKNKIYNLELINIGNEYFILEQNGSVYEFSKDKFEKVKNVLKEKAI